MMMRLKFVVAIALIGLVSFQNWTPAAPDWGALERGILSEQNKIRQNPQSYIPVLQDWLNRMDSQGRVRLNSQTFLVTQEGKRAVQEAIAFLRHQRPVGTLVPSSGLTKAAKDHAQAQQQGGIGHTGQDGSRPIDRGRRYGQPSSYGENIAYGPTTAQSVIMNLVIDDGVADRGHRTNIFNPKYNVAGAGCGSHATYRVVCVINYAGGYVEGRTTALPQLSVQVNNLSGKDIIAVYRVPTSAPDWGDNLLKGQRLSHRRSGTFTSNAVIKASQRICAFKLRAVSVNGQEHIVPNANLCQGKYQFTIQ